MVRTTATIDMTTDLEDRTTPDILVGEVMADNPPDVPMWVVIVIGDGASLYVDMDSAEKLVTALIHARSKIRQAAIDELKRS